MDSPKYSEIIGLSWFRAKNGLNSSESQAEAHGGDAGVLRCLTVLFRKLSEVIRFRGVHGPCAMGLSVVLDEIIKGWLGFPDPS